MLSGSRQINDYLQSSNKMDLAQLPDSTYKMKTVDQKKIIEERKEYWERLFAKVIYFTFIMIKLMTFVLV